jgi:hypothetical protein
VVESGDSGLRQRRERRPRAKVQFVESAQGVFVSPAAVTQPFTKGVDTTVRFVGKRAIYLPKEKWPFREQIFRSHSAARVRYNHWY